MYLKVRKSKVTGSIKIPGSKSHTIRALFLASLADGISVIKNPLISDDALSAVKVLKAFGAEITHDGDHFKVKGFNGKPAVPENIVDVGNSGTTLRFGAVTASLVDGYTVMTGDEQIRRRPMGPLMEAICSLGGLAVSTRGNGSAPIVIKGKIMGGSTSLDSVTSQYLSALLINTPLFDNDTRIELTRLNEVPYVGITTWWLDKLGIEYTNDGYKHFHIPGRQQYRSFDTTIPGDFSSATFFAVQAAVSGSVISLENLDMSDPQGDKAIFSILADMGAIIDCGSQTVSVGSLGLKGRDIDMNATPDALPAMAVAGCFAEGETKLLKVPQARLKETDRINVMCLELKKMGADIYELPEGLVIRKSTLRGCHLDGHGDHRVVMALAIAGLNAEGETTISTAEAMSVTFPEFADIIRSCGGEVELVESL